MARKNWKTNVCLVCMTDCGEPCAAHEELNRVYMDLRTEQKDDIVNGLRGQLEAGDAEVDEGLRALAERLIVAMPELSIIPTYDIKVGYVRSYEPKIDNGKAVYADCRKVTKTYKAFLPFDFIITVYDPNACLLSENQMKILMLHELKHIGLGEKGLTIENHDVEDFLDILERYGVTWNWLNAEVPDILEAGDGRAD